MIPGSSTAIEARDDQKRKKFVYVSTKSYALKGAFVYPSIHFILNGHEKLTPDQTKRGGIEADADRHNRARPAPHPDLVGMKLRVKFDCDHK